MSEYRSGWERWLDPEEAAKDARRIENQTDTVLTTPNGFMKWFSDFGYMQLVQTPLGASFYQGLCTITEINSARYGRKTAVAEKSRLSLQCYPVKTLIAAAVFQEEAVGVGEIIDPLSEGIRKATFSANYEFASRELFEGDGDKKEAIANFTGVLASLNLSEMRTLEGRIRLFIDPAAEVLVKPERIEIALARIKEGRRFGSRGDFSSAVALAMRKLLTNSS